MAHGISVMRGAGSLRFPTAWDRRPDNDSPPRPEGAAARPPRRGPAARRRSWSSRARAGTTACPPPTPGELRQVISRGANRNDLVLYLETFAHTVAVMQTREALERVAAECAEDLADDGVVYAEVRFAPELHIENGPEPGRGGRGGAGRVRAAARRARADRQGALLGDAPAGQQPGDRRAGPAPPRPGRLRLRHRRARGRPPAIAPPGRLLAGDARATSTSRSTPARRSGCPRSPRPCTSAAPSAWATACGIIDDIAADGDGEARLGRLAAFVRDRRVPLEMCPSSNVHVGAAPSIAEHPIGLLGQAALPGHGQHGQPPDERDDALARSSCTCTSALRLGPRRHPLGDDQRDEERVPAVRRAAAAHQPGHQARLRDAGGRRLAERTGRSASTPGRAPAPTRPSRTRRRSSAGRSRAAAWSSCTAGGSVGLDGRGRGRRDGGRRPGHRDHPPGARGAGDRPPRRDRSRRGGDDARAQGDDGPALRALRRPARRDRDAGGADRGAHVDPARHPPQAGRPAGRLRLLGRLLALLDHAVDQRFVRPEHRADLLSDADPDDLLDALAAWRPSHDDKWIDEVGRSALEPGIG